MSGVAGSDFSRISNLFNRMRESVLTLAGRAGGRQRSRPGESSGLAAQIVQIFGRWFGWLQLQIERRYLDGFLLHSNQSREAIGEGVGNSKLQSGMRPSRCTRLFGSEKTRD